jgi:hypothetical protein
MSIPSICPSCKAESNAPDNLAGKRVKCPKCKELMRIPLADAEDGFDVVESEPAMTETTKRARPRSEDPAERPRRKPHRERDEEDEEDDRPRRRRNDRGRDAARSGVSPLRYVIGGIVLVGLLVGIYFLYSSKFNVPDEDPIAERDPAIPIGVNPIGPNPKGANPNGADPIPKTLPTPKSGTGTLPPFHNIASFAISGDGRTFAACGGISLGQGGGGTRVAPSIRTWESTGNDPNLGREYRARPATSIDRIAISADGRTLAGWSLRKVTFWNVGTAEASSTVAVAMPGLNHSIPREIVLSDDGRTARYVNDGNLVTAVQGQPNATITPLTGKPGDHARIVKNANRIFEVRSVLEKNIVELRAWDATSGEPMPSFPLEGMKSTIQFHYAVSANGRTLAVSDEPESSATIACMRLFHANTGREIRLIHASRDKKIRVFSQMAFSKDGTQIVCVGSGASGSSIKILELFSFNGGVRKLLQDDSALVSGKSKFGLPTFSSDGKAIHYIDDERAIARLAIPLY